MDSLATGSLYYGTFFENGFDTALQNISVSLSSEEPDRAKEKKNNPNENYNPSCIEQSHKKCRIRQHDGTVWAELGPSSACTHAANSISAPVIDSEPLRHKK